MGWSHDRVGNSMKIILSRKGFDSGAGGVPSPIFPDGHMVSLPIPTRRAPLRYGQVAWDGGTLGTLIADLTGRPHGHLLPCHLDPDLSPAARSRLPGWRAAFGQVGAAQQHLVNQGVGVGDLFLFFGWFRCVEETAEGWRYRRGAPDIHVLFGWLQIGEILAVDDPAKHLQVYPWLAEHPHLDGSYGSGNTVYIAAKALQLGDTPTTGATGAAGATGTAGAGTFPRFTSALQLTEPGRSRSVWRLPAWFLPPAGPALSYHLKPALWQRDADDCLLNTVGRGQEFVIDVGTSAEASQWVAGLFHGDLLRPEPASLAIPAAPACFSSV